MTNHLPSFLFACCMSCDEINSAALMRRGNKFICGNCEARERGRPTKICVRCHKDNPYENNHVRGRKISDETEVLCINCHRIVHAIKEAR